MSKKKVWVTWDPLLERVICVHDAPDCVCEDCEELFNERNEKGQYQLEEKKCVVKRYNKAELKEL